LDDTVSANKIARFLLFPVYQPTSFSILRRRYRRCSMIYKPNYLPITMLSTKTN